MINAALTDLLEGIAPVADDVDIECSGLQLDSRIVRPNDLYVGDGGADDRVDGFVREALESGAVAVLVDDSATLGDDLLQQRNVLFIPALAKNVGLIAARYFGFPSNNMLLVGVTGTNGKTSCCVMQAQLLALLDVKTNYIGTLGAGALDELAYTGFTTPPADVLQKLLYRAYSLYELYR